MSSDSVKGKTLEETVPLFLEHCQMMKDEVKRIEIETRGQHSKDVLQEQ